MRDAAASRDVSRTPVGATGRMPAWVVEPTLFEDEPPRLRRGGRVDCLWCGRPIPARARRDALTCSKRCRQARHRFTRDVGSARAVAPGRGRARRLAYADPPYPGTAARYYRDHPDYGGEVDHGELIGRLSTYDGWALSTSAAALPFVLALCPARVRVAVWVRGERPAPANQALNGWEPVIYSPARPLRREPAERVVDVLHHGAGPRLTDPARVIGAKPAVFARWLFELLNAQPGDSLDDLFPGSGTIGRAWALYTAAVAPVVARDALLTG